MRHLWGTGAAYHGRCTRSPSSCQTSLSPTPWQTTERRLLSSWIECFIRRRTTCYGFDLTALRNRSGVSQAWSPALLWPGLYNRSTISQRKTTRSDVTSIPLCTKGPSLLYLSFLLYSLWQTRDRRGCYGVVKRIAISVEEPKLYSIDLTESRNRSGVL